MGWRAAGYGLLASVMALLAGCPQQPAVESFSGTTMGSTYSVKYVPGPTTPSVAAVQASTEAFLAELDRQVSTYRADSDLAQFNRLPAGSCRRMPAYVLELVGASALLSLQTEGALDPTLEPVLELWGFSGGVQPETNPTAEAITQAQQLTGLQHLRTEQGELCKEVALRLNFNSVAAGFAVDQVSALLREQGVESFMVEITGEIYAQGKKPDGKAWQIAIESPLENQLSFERVLPLDGQSLSTSGDYRNYQVRDGKRYSHTIDPQTAAPIEHALASVTVADPSAVQADGLSTALLVMGPEIGLAFAESQDIPALFVSRTENGFTTVATTAFGRLFPEAGQ